MCSMYEQMNFLESQGRNTEIDSDAFRKVIKEAKDIGTKTVLFIGGEPFVREDLFDLIDYTIKLELNPIIVTNGTLLNAQNIQKCFEARIKWLSISIDAASEKAFSKIRGENALGKIINNIELFNKLKRDKKGIPDASAFSHKKKGYVRDKQGNEQNWCVKVIYQAERREGIRK